MPGSNVIDIIAEYVDHVSGPVKGTEGVIEHFGEVVKRAGAVIAAAFTFENIVEKTAGAQKAVSLLTIAYDNSGESARRSKQEIIGFAEEQQKATTFSTEAIVKSQTALLRYGRVTKEVFDRARDSALNVASALDTDLVSASETVGRALERPSTGLRQLRSIGIIFSASQQELIQRMEKTGRTAQAQAIILDELEKKYGGAAQAARGTLAGALDSLKNAFASLFESTEAGASATADGLNEITKVISDPEFKTNLQTFTAQLLEFAGGFLKLTSMSVSGWKMITGLVADGIDSLQPQTNFEKLIDKQAAAAKKLNDAVQAQSEGRAVTVFNGGIGFDIFDKKRQDAVIKKFRQELEDAKHEVLSASQAPGTGIAGEDWIRAGIIGGHQSTEVKSKVDMKKMETDDERRRAAEDARAALLDSLEPVDVTALQSKLDPMVQLLRDLGEEAETAGDKLNREFARTKVVLDELDKSEQEAIEKRSGGSLQGAQDLWDQQAKAVDRYKKKIEEVIDSQLQLIDLNEIESRKLIEPISIQAKRINAIVGTVEEGLRNMAAQGQITGKAILRYLLAAFESKALFSAIDSLGSYLRKSLASSNTKGSAATGLIGFFGSLFGAAGGGDTMGLEVVGEQGAELRSGRSKVWNSQQLRAAMGGGGRNGSIVINGGDIIVQGNADEKILRTMRAEQERNNKKMLESFSNVLHQNDYRPLR